MSCYTYLYILLPIEVRSALRGAKPDGGLGADFFLRFFRLHSSSSSSLHPIACEFFGNGLTHACFVVSIIFESISIDCVISI